MTEQFDKGGSFTIHKGLCVSPPKCREAAKCLGPCEKQQFGDMRSIYADVERRMVEMIRHIGVKAGVAEATYGAMCHEARSILRSIELDYERTQPEVGEPKCCGMKDLGAIICGDCPTLSPQRYETPK